MELEVLSTPGHLMSLSGARVRTLRAEARLKGWGLV